MMGWELARRRAHGTLVLLNGCGQMLGGMRVTGSDAGRMDVRETTVAAQRWMLPRCGEASGRGGVCGGTSAEAAAVWNCWPSLVRYSDCSRVAANKSILFVIFPDA